MSLTDAPPPQQTSRAEPPWCAVYFRYPERWSSPRWWLAFVSTVLVALLAAGCQVTLVIWLLRGSGTAGPALGRVAATATFGALAIATMLVIGSAVHFIWRAYQRWEARQMLAGTEPGAPQVALYQAMMKSSLRNGILRFRSRDEWIATARSTGITTWVEKRLESVVRVMERPESPMEPERLGTYWGSLESRFGTVAVALSAFHLLRGNMVAGGVWALVALINLWRLVARGALFEPVVVGQGWVQHGKARWTVDDSVAYLRLRGGNVQVTFEGPSGMLRTNLPVKPGKTAALVTFWERWTHPHPRLDQTAFDA